MSDHQCAAGLHAFDVDARDPLTDMKAQVLSPAVGAEGVLAGQGEAIGLDSHLRHIAGGTAGINVICGLCIDGRLLLEIGLNAELRHEMVIIEESMHAGTTPVKVQGDYKGGIRTSKDFLILGEER